ncbi:hypothetical protein [Bacillus pinisoli]|uniref:hypothetical protein n=1 Tax=Bacillus pinisoli TaxID=2901866 RepID=UPI001FF60F5E|nr:hypothetical protein [Bacillus pinisoli]
MKTIYQAGFGILLLILTVLLFLKGVQLWTFGTNVDGGGVGIYFLGLEINDHVKEASIPNYALSFAGAGIITLTVTIFTVLKLFKRVSVK